MIDPNNFDDLCMALRRHPDFRGCVIWQRRDIEDAAAEYKVDPDELDNMVDLDTWEDMACSDGWDHTINQAAHELSEQEEES
jgi:hypothetical protein